MRTEVAARMLSEGAREVLETMFFAEAVGLGEAANIPNEVLAASVGFRGQPCGSLTVAVPPAVAHELAASFLGLEMESLESGQVKGVLCEMTNMICGSVLSRLTCEGTFDLDPPVEVSWPVPGLESAIHETLLLDSGRIGAVLELRT